MLTLAASSLLVPTAISPSSSPSHHPPLKLCRHLQSQHSPLPLSSPQLTCFTSLWRRGGRRRSLVVTNFVPPSNGSLVLAFVLPLSLILVTVFTSIRIADKLDQDFLEELALKEAMAEDEEDLDKEVQIPVEPEPALSRTRNRPKREA